MPTSTLRPLHREITPARQCKQRGCKVWLTSANPDPRCAEHGGWSTQRLRSQAVFRDRADLYRELLELEAA